MRPESERGKQGPKKEEEEESPPPSESLSLFFFFFFSNNSFTKWLQLVQRWDERVREW
jgi:hypothetical protein